MVTYRMHRQIQILMPPVHHGWFTMETSTIWEGKSVPMKYVDGLWILITQIWWNKNNGYYPAINRLFYINTGNKAAHQSGGIVGEVLCWLSLISLSTLVFFCCFFCIFLLMALTTAWQAVVLLSVRAKCLHVTKAPEDSIHVFLYILWAV